MTPEMSTRKLVNYYGSNCIGAERVGREMGPCECACIVFAGGFSEIPEIKARQFTINDIHRAVVNLGMVTSIPSLRAQLQDRVERLPFHPDVLESARRRCIEREAAWAHTNGDGGLFGASQPKALPSDAPDLEWAIDYFVCSWMGRGGRSGQEDEFSGSMSVRFNAGGGGSNVRFRSAAKSLEAWERVLLGAEFTVLGFVPVCRIRAMLVAEHAQLLIGGGEHRKSRKSFFRRLAESKGSPAIDHEEVIVVRKPA